MLSSPRAAPRKLFDEGGHKESTYIRAPRSGPIIEHGHKGSGATGLGEIKMPFPSLPHQSTVFRLFGLSGPSNSFFTPLKCCLAFVMA